MKIDRTAFGLYLISAAASLACLYVLPSHAQEQTSANSVAKKPVEAPMQNHELKSKWPGMQLNGTMLLPSQWSLKPSGKHLLLGDFPVAMAIHPSENIAAILHAGYGEHEVVITDLDTLKIVSRASIPQTFTGISFNRSGTFLFASGAEKEIVHQFNYRNGMLSDRAEIQVAKIEEKQVPAGVAVSVDDQSLFVACPWGSSVYEIALASDSGKRRISFGGDDFPLMVLPDRTGKKLYVSLWGGASVAVVDLESFTVQSKWQTDSHPTEMILTEDESTLFVSCANSNIVNVIDTRSGKTLESISSALFPKANNGSTPSSISLSKDERVLLIANATNNNLAVIDVSERGKSRSLGFIPVGWYPTSVRFSPHDDKIYVTNGKGLTPKANRQGPNPLSSPPRTTMEYIGGLFQGTLSKIVPPTPVEMSEYTKSSYACSPLQEDHGTVSSTDPNNPIPGKVGDPSPIKYCLYIIKENRTYDQVFGDMPKGNGDPSICLFPEKVTPNHHAIANEFVLLDNFYVESEVSADGHEWTMAAYATDYVEKVWPLTYRGSKEKKLQYPSEGSTPIAFPSSGYLWDKAKEAGVTYRSYGEFVINAKDPGTEPTTNIEALIGHFDKGYHGYDLSYPDVKRTERFVEELHRFESEGEMPRLQILRLGNDHTSGTAPGKLTPIAMVADNDLALGRLIEAVSKSKFWNETAIFVVEDDAQNGSGHVDAHRTVAMVVSPYTKRGIVDSNMYSTSSMLRTMELILGMQPMTQFDAAALPMFHSFTSSPDFTPYSHRPAMVDLNEMNSPNAFGAKLSSTFDFSKEDAADDLLLNEVIWKSIRGADSPMPPPVRAGFVFNGGLEEDEDEDEFEGDSDDDDDDDRDVETHAEKK